MNTLKEAFHCNVGYSDHTEGIHVGIAAAALGATILEKHFTLDKSMPGPDHKASLDPEEFKLMEEHITLICGHASESLALMESLKLYVGLRNQFSPIRIL